MVRYGYLAAVFLCVNMLLAPLAAAQDGKDLFAESRFILSTQQGSFPGFMKKKIDLKSNDMMLKEILSSLEQKVPVQFAYMESLVAGNERFSFNLRQLPFHEVLSRVLDRTGIGYGTFEDGYIVLRKQEAKSAQQLQATITGTITDGTSGEGLPGANVSIEGTTRGASTDAEGQYRITGVEPGTHTLVATFIGYEESRREVNVTEGQESITVDFTLQPGSMALEEMVVIGYGTQQRSDITGSISSVGADEISSVPSSGVQGALQGRVAGVNITPSTGQPGAPIDMNIRGVSSFGNNNPLFVVDGVPVFSESGGTFNPLATLNPDNIESVEILKDASAAAIYGARAANGVVLISTKNGRAGETQFSLKISRGVSSVSETIDMMNSRQFIDYSIEAFQNGGRATPQAFEEPLLSENLSRNTDWQDAAFSPADMQNYAFTVSGGNENATYAFTGGYYDEEGTLPNSGFKRYSVRVNTSFNIGDNLEVGESMELSRGTWTGTFGPTTDLMQELLQSSPTMPIYNDENLGGFAGPTIEYGPVNRSNQVGQLSLTDNEEVRNRLLGNVYAEYDFMDNLSYRFSAGGDISFNESKSFTPMFQMGNRSNATADLSEGRYSTNTYLIENTLTYSQVFNEVHDLTVLAGFTQQESWNSNVNGTVEEFPSNNVRTIAAGYGQTSLSGDESAWALRSQIGRLNYSYDDKYNLMASIRRDGSSRFGENNRYGIFPSVSGSWIITNEGFMEDIEPLSNLALRASWGQVGSQEVSDFASYATIEPVARYIFGEGQELVPGATYLQLGNPDLKWEVTTQTNIGLDIGFFDERLSFVMDYYMKDTDDILLRIPVPTTSGIRRNNGAFRNSGSLYNEGFEFTASYQNSVGDFDYTLSGNFTTSKNEVKKLGTGEPIIAQLSSDPNYATTITRIGNEIGAFWGYVMDGVFADQTELDNHADQPGAAPGDIRFKDLNEDGVIDANDQTVIGSPFPDFTYGFNVNLLYKNFDMTIFLQGKQGHDVFNLVWAGINDGEGDNNATTAMLDRWTPDNRETTVPRAVIGDPNQNFRPSTRFVEDGSYLRIQNIQLGYSLGNDVLERLNIPRLRVFVSAKNLFTFSNYRSFNPEVGTLTTDSQSSLTRGIDFGAYPIPRVIEGGLQIDFN